MVIVDAHKEKPQDIGAQRNLWKLSIAGKLIKDP